ncbi:hypothetical protein DSLASN_19370 [Desulfoluna limicola]|uniref:Uncharacterized protein n=1 Tax=Desulfoluna limicola TaxID=2810562 RepID=A0ABM7PGE4_9BACT|nr:hypothetical protein DSLASN_19370 [Desulfoluna limicola]
MLWVPQSMERITRFMGVLFVMTSLSVSAGAVTDQLNSASGGPAGGHTLKSLTSWF